MDTVSDKKSPSNTHDFATLEVHAGQERAGEAGARAVPIYATSSFVFESAAYAADLFAGQVAGNQYGRMHNPTVEAFVQRLVALEGGRAGLAVSSGQAASATTLFTLARPGAQLVFSSELFGGTFGLASKILEPWGCRISKVAPTAEEVGSVLTDDAAVVWLETIANPSGTVPDIAAIAEVTRAAGVPLVVDNTFGCGGYLCRPLELGADIVVHSATKWIGGHGSFIGGAIIDGGSYDWTNGKFPAFVTPDGRGRTYVSRGGHTAFAVRARDLGLSTMGMTLSPYAASLGLQGLETLSLRSQRACDSALELAGWLTVQAGVRRVIYPGLPSHPSYETAKRTLRHGFGAVLCFEAATQDAAYRFLDRVELASHLANIGDAKTVVIHPWTTTHVGVSEADRRRAGVTPELIRVSVGLESPGDLKQDFARALEG
ncbi:MAG TPA: aminotransferase class V-fold PLP-dependent enzyme [Trueperaceae bacterium]